MANELSPMAAQTYAFNFLNEDMEAESKKESPSLKSTLWLNSHFELKNLKNRLKEKKKDIQYEKVKRKDLCKST